MKDLHRKLLQMGHTSVGITLPREWAHRYDLAPGQEVLVTELADGSLRIVPAAASLTPDPSEQRIGVMCPSCKVMGSYPLLASRHRVRLLFAEHGRAVHAKLGPFQISDLADRVAEQFLKKAAARKGLGPKPTPGASLPPAT